MIYKVFPAVLFFLFSFSSSKIFYPEFKNNNLIVSKTVPVSSMDNNIEMVYNNLHANNFALPKEESFIQALKGFYLLKEKGLIKKNILTLVDFSLSSNLKRLWVIDLTTNTVLFLLLLTEEIPERNSPIVFRMHNNLSKVV
jgi:hypothetical protein